MGDSRTWIYISEDQTHLCVPQWWHHLLVTAFSLVCLAILSVLAITGYRNIQKWTNKSQQGNSNSKKKEGPFNDDYSPRNSEKYTKSLSVAINSSKKSAWEISFRELKFGRVIGRGNIGCVYEGRWRGTRVAIKTLHGNWFNDNDMVERFRIEITLMSNLQHPNVLLFIAAVIDRPAAEKATDNIESKKSTFPKSVREQKQNKTTIALVTEFCEHGSLYDFIHSEVKMNWKFRLNMAIDIARGMHYLHARANVIQRDLKSANILVDSNLVGKIADFGLSRKTGSLLNMETYCGTPANMAPEIVRQEKYSVKADVFSYSIILWELVTREDPYPEISGLALAYAVANDGLRPSIPQYCPAEFADLIERCWAPNQDDRPDFGEILDFLQLLDVQVKKKTTASEVDGKSGFGSLPRFLKEHEEKLKSTLPKFVPEKQPFAPRVSRGSGGIKADVRSILLNESFIKGTGDDEYLLGGGEEAHRTHASSVDSVVVIRDVKVSVKETSGAGIPPHSRQSPSLDETSPRENRKLSFDV